GHDCRRSFSAAETIIVAWSSDARAKKVGVFVYCLNGSDEEGQEHQVVARAAGRSEQIYTCIRNKRPVVMFATSVYAFKWFFMEKHAEVVPLCHALHQVHHQLIVIVRNVHAFEGGSDLKLRGSDLI